MTYAPYRPKRAVPSLFVHPVYKVIKWTDNYLVDHEDRRRAGTTEYPGEEADVVSSEIFGDDGHTIMLDLDVPASLVPSSTEGHSHLYIDVRLSWRKYKRLLKVLKDARVIEEGYYNASVARRGTHLRLPGVRK